MGLPAFEKAEYNALRLLPKRRDNSVTPAPLAPPTGVKVRVFSIKYAADHKTPIFVNPIYYYVWWNKPGNPELKSIVEWQNDANKIPVTSRSDFNDHAIIDMPWNTYRKYTAHFQVRFENPQTGQISEPSTQLNFCYGDMNGNGVVDQDDINFINDAPTRYAPDCCSYLGRPLLSFPPEDIDGDGWLGSEGSYIGQGTNCGQ